MFLGMKKIVVLFFVLWNFQAEAQPSSPKSALPVPEAQYRAAKQSGDAGKIADAAVLAGEAHLQSANYKRSIDFFLVAKDIYKSQNNAKGLSEVSCRLAENYYRSGNAKRYQDYIALAQQLIGKDTLSSQYELLLDTQIGYYQAKKKFRQVKYLSERKARLHTNPQLKTVAKPQAPEPKAIKKPVTVSKVAIAPLEKQSNNLIVFFAIAIAALCIGCLIYYFRKDRQRKLSFKKQLEQQDSQLLANISQALSNAGGNRRLVLDIGQHLHLLSEIKAEKKVPDFAMEPVGPLLQSLSAPFLEAASQQRIEVISNIDPAATPQLVDKNTLETVFYIIWSEALLHTAEQQTLYFSATVENQQLALRISYPCGPITEKHLPHLLDSLYMALDGKYPNPVGFALLQSIVTWYDGKIELALDANLLRIMIRLPLAQMQQKQPKTVPGLVL